MEDVIDLNEIEAEQQKDGAEISVIDDSKNLEVGKNDNIEIIEKEEKEDGKETRSDNVIENEEQEDVIDLKEREVEQHTVDAEIFVKLEVENPLNSLEHLGFLHLMVREDKTMSLYFIHCDVS